MVMVPHLVRAQGTYLSQSHKHTTCYMYTCDGLVELEWEEKQQQISVQKRRGGFSVPTLKKKEWKQMPEGERVLDHRLNILKLKDSLLGKGPPAHFMNTKIWVSAAEWRGRVAMKHIREVWRSWTITRDDEYCWLVASGDRKGRSDVGRFRSFADKVSQAVDHSLNFIKSFVLSLQKLWLWTLSCDSAPHN